MNRPLRIALVAAAVVIAIGVAWMSMRAEPRKPWPKHSSQPATPDNPRSNERDTGAAQTAAETARRNDRLVLEIERALVAGDPQERETAFNFLLPELIQAEPQRVVDMVARQVLGEARDALRTELARQWIARDRDAAIDWMKSLEDDERRASAYVAARALAATAPGHAIDVADQLDIGRDDGYLEHLFQIWATEDLAAAERWLAEQPEGPRKAQLAARIEHVRRQPGGARDGRD